MFNIEEELLKYNLTKDTYEQCLKDCSDKVEKISDIDWQEIVDKYDLGVHYDTLRKASQTIFGGAFVSQYFKEKISNTESVDYNADLRVQKQEIIKEKQKLSDERCELKRLLREQARKESFIDLVKNTMREEMTVMKFNDVKNISSVGDNDLVISLSDIHAGLGVDNYWNVYDMDVLAERLDAYADKVISVQQLHKSENAYVVLCGDIISGIIHPNLRLENNENVIQQIKQVSLLIMNFLSKIHKYFGKVNVYSVSGNHSRLMPNKEQHLKGEELDALVTFCVNIGMAEYDNVIVHEDNDYDDTIADFHVRNNFVYAVHGDKDSPNNVVQNLTMLTGFQPDIVLSGHRHTNGLITEHDTKIVQFGCMSGADNYSVDKRLCGKPEQMILVINEDGIDCMYDVQMI